MHKTESKVCIHLISPQRAEEVSWKKSVALTKPRPSADPSHLLNCTPHVHVSADKNSKGLIVIITRPPLADIKVMSGAHKPRLAI